MSDQELFELAIDALDKAYAPYSNFLVGAAVLTDDGRAFQGCNVENASYGLTICAERSAVTNAVFQGARKIIAVAVAGESTAPWPCGACRQVLNEFSDDMVVLCGKKGGGFERVLLSDLLPHSFGPNDLK